MTLKFKHGILATAITASLALTACQKPADKPVEQKKTEQKDAKAPEKANSEKSVAAEKGKEAEALVKSFSDMAYAGYSDSLEGAKKLQAAIDKFVAEPTEANLKATKQAYIDSRIPYMQTEVFRFDEGFVTKNDKRAIESVDAWEVQVNAWPLDEALIDYVDGSHYEGKYKDKSNIVNGDTITVGSESKDTADLTPELLASMNEYAGSEENVTTGYHAIEFLLWGQDLNGVGAGAGKRPVTDYSLEKGKCTNGATVAEDTKTCTRRGEYLKAAAKLLVTDLEGMVAQWKPNSENTLRSDLLARADDNAVRQVMYEMGSLALGELASERLQVALVTGSTEDTHECFSDQTHTSYAMNAQGIKNVFEGNYNGKGGYGIKQYLLDMGKEKEANDLQAKFDNVGSAFDVIVAETNNNDIHVDQMVGTVAQAKEVGVSKEEQEKRRSWIAKAVTTLQEETASLEAAAASVGIDKLDADTGTQF